MIDLPVPKHLVIGPHEFKVEFDHAICHDESRAGEISFRTQTIKLDPHQADTENQVGLWHEVFHGIASTYGIELEHKDLDRMAVGLTMFLKDNFGAQFNLDGIEGK